MHAYRNTREEKRAYYDQLKFISREQVAASFKRRLQLEGNIELWDKTLLSSINEKALKEAATIWPLNSHKSPYNKSFGEGWYEFYKQYFYCPSFFDLAIWQTVDGVDVLQGLCLGRPSRKKEHLRIFRLEKNWADNRMKGGINAPVLACAERYAQMLECKRVVVKKGLDSTFESIYGYEPYDLHGGYGEFISKELM
ncbi:hypothetical protein [Thalassospira lucentensis]|uniref:hypothetical protein n=1 Tax=Thalassospira lucentensis TaxID=168935 RepID=UPI003D2A1C0F